MEQQKFLVIIGPTASGKTARAVEAARTLDGEIISADSRQVYKGMDIGTGKDLDEYGDVPYHLIDIMPAGAKYNLYGFLRDYHSAFNDITRRGKMPILCGGTGMYVEAAINGIKLPEVPENKELRAELANKSLAELTQMLSTMKSLHNTTDVDTAKRAIRAIEIACFYRDNPRLAADVMPHALGSAVIVGVDIPRDVRRKRISERLDRRLDEGMADEVRRLIDSGVSADDLMYYGLEYKFVTQYVIGQLSLQQMRERLEIAIHQFAKRQMTWFRGMERRGLFINWLPWDMPRDVFNEKIVSLLS